MSLPDAWVDRIFEKLTLVYGHQFLSRWDGMPIADVKASWAQELSRFQQNPGALAYAMENLPAHKAPSVLEFRALCNSQHSPARQEPLIALGNRPKTPQEMAAERHIERIKRLKREHPEYGGVCWAFALEIKDREEPEWVSHRARQLYRDVLATYRARRAQPEAQ